ncbi:xylose isomerase-like protein [Triangularia verruculosa]|uniref:Xylose isomerase-like protein n=1 Tax=Triangularia verruculosa TaxID=2587418 RepID=A0AAN6XM84_9PEZI|nr:xylose isomerase-like protein [Triangularia verruculosa]
MSTTNIPLAFASCSIGLPKHTLHQKIEAIRSAGFQGIELSFPDLISYASLHFGRDIAEDDYSTLSEAAKAVKELCSRHELTIMVLQPFSNFEGWPSGSSERDGAFARAKGWIRIMDAAGIKMLQVGSSDSVGISSSFEDLAADLRELADMLAPHGIKLAYENWCWATRAPKWKDVWEIAKMVDRPNVGLCLDTFQTAGGEWGDPTTESGLVQGVSAEDLTRRYMDSLKELTRTVPPEKIYFLQISDAYKLDKPLADQEEDGLRPRGRWSHDWRPLPYDGGYLPVTEFAEAVLNTGFKGWVSVEVFDGKFKDKYGDDLMGFAHKAMSAVQLLLSTATTAGGEAK